LAEQESDELSLLVGRTIERVGRDITAIGVGLIGGLLRGSR